MNRTSTGQYCMVSEKHLQRAKEVNPQVECITQENEKVVVPNDEIHIQLSEGDHKLMERYATQHNVSLNSAYNAVISHSLEIFRKVTNFVGDLDENEG